MDPAAELDLARRGARSRARVAAVAMHELPGDAPSDFELIAAAQTGTEGALATLVERRYGAVLRYVAGDRTWAAYDSTRWARDSDLQARALVQGIVRNIFEAAASAAGDQNRTTLAKFAIKADKRGFQAGALALAEPRLAVDVADFDADGEVLNLANGTLDLKTCELRPHDPADMCSKIAGTLFDPRAEYSTWLSCLRRWTCGDEELLGFLQRLTGYLLVADACEDRLPLLTGRGRNGKTTFVETVKATLGGYAGTIGLDSLLEPPRGRDGAHHSDDVAALAGKRVAFANESMKGRKLDSARIKMLTGGDTVSARRIFGHQFTFTNRARLVLSTNHLPRLDGDDQALEARLVIVPFDVVIPEGERDTGLRDRLKREALPGVLNWALAGLAEWRRRGLGTATVAREATADYFRREDPARRFIESRLQAAPAGWMARHDLKQRWEEFLLTDEGVPTTSAALDVRPLYEALRSRGYEESKRRGITGFKGIELVSPPTREDGA